MDQPIADARTVLSQLPTREPSSSDGRRQNRLPAITKFVSVVDITDPEDEATVGPRAVEQFEPETQLVQSWPSPYLHQIQQNEE
jgi:hypothetical protein